ncbi:MAG TPA: ribonuclease P protein component [Armatimonadota bacterium]
MLPRAQRLVKPSDFTRAFRKGRAQSDDLLLAKVLTRKEPGFRLGVSVGKKVGPSVVRNRVKRRLREATRSVSPELKVPVDLVLVAKLPASGASYADLRGSLVRLLSRAGVLQAPRGEPDPGRSERAGE